MTSQVLVLAGVFAVCVVRVITPRLPVCQGMHEEARREISRLELRLHREREWSARARASLHAQVRDLQEKLSVLLKSEASRGSPPKTAATPGLELTARRAGGEERLPPKRISPKSVRASGPASEYGDDVPAASGDDFPVFPAHDDGGSIRGGATNAARTRECVDGGAEGSASPRSSNNGLGRETIPKSVILDILKRASCSNPREQRKEPSSNGPTTQNAPPTTPKSKEDEGYMLVAAAVTMAPREEQGEFLLTLSEKERSGALRWMDPQDVARALALCPNGDDLLKHLPLARLKPVFVCMEAPDRYITLQQVSSTPMLFSLGMSSCIVLGTSSPESFLAQRDAEDAAQLVELLDVRAGKMLLGDLHSETLRVQIMDLLPAEWLHRAVADTVYARRILPLICHYFYQLMVVAC